MHRRGCSLLRKGGEGQYPQVRHIQAQGVLKQRGHSGLANQNAPLGTATTLSQPVRLDDKYWMQEGLGWWACGSFSEIIPLTLLFCSSKTKIRQRLPAVLLQPRTAKVSLAGHRNSKMVQSKTLSRFIESSKHETIFIILIVKFYDERPESNSCSLQFSFSRSPQFRLTRSQYIVGILL